MRWWKRMAMKLLRINPATQTKIVTITEPYSFEENVLRNRLWYRGDPSELDQFFRQTATDSVSKSRFWAAVPLQDSNIRKIHSGLPAMIVERLADIVIADLDRIELSKEENQELWDEISEDNELDELIGETIAEVLAVGDGAFKITFDRDITDYPIIEFYSGERVEYRRERNRLKEVIFYSAYTHKNEEYRLEEIFGKGYIRYKLFNKYDKEVPLSMVPELSDLEDAGLDTDLIMAVPLRFYKSQKWKGRGKSLFDSKTDSFDALDEVISQWVDAIRDGRVNKYIPEDLIPKDPQTGDLLKPDPFTNRFIKMRSAMNEDKRGLIEVTQAQIAYEAFVTSYSSKLDMCLQGIVSPATLGIDLKKTDNAEAQREKEKATLYTRGKIIDALNDTIPLLVNTVMKVYDIMHENSESEYVASVQFGEYASPSFDAVVETVGKAKSFGIMSTERAVEEMYGDTWTDEEKAEEVARIKAEEGIVEIEEPAVNKDGDPPPGDE